MLLKNGTLYTDRKGGAFQGDLRIENGKIAAVAPSLTPRKKEKVLDFSGKSIVPGFIDVSTCIGVVEAGKRLEETNRTDPSHKASPELRMMDGIFWDDAYFRKAAESGVTTLIVNSKYESPVGGQSCAVKTAGTSVSRRILRPYVDMHGTLGDPVKNPYETRTSPLSRMGIARMIREVLSRESLSRGMDSTPNGAPSARDGVVEILRKEIPLKLSADLYQDILQVLAVADEFGVRAILDGGSEAARLIDELARRKIPVILGSLMMDPTREACLRGDETLAKQLEEAGVPFCFSTHHPVLSIELFHASACLFATHGVSEAGVLRAITETPARVFGLDDRVGKIASGMDADLVVFEGDPFQSMSRVVTTMIDGETVYEA